MNKLILTIVAGIAIISCDNRDKEFFAVSSAPVVLQVTKYGSDTIVSLDSVKVSPISAKPGSVITLNTGNGTAAKTLNVINSYLPQSSYKVVVNGSNYVDGISLLNGNNKVIVYPQTPGDYTTIFLVQDVFGHNQSISLRTIAFDNKLPVVYAQAEFIGINAPREYSLDASSSYDADYKYGGAIAFYSYYLNDILVASTKSNKITWNFSSGGNYILKVIAKDNDGAEASFSTAQITVN